MMSSIIQSFDAAVFNFFNHTLAAYWLDYIMVMVTQFGNGWAFGILAAVLLRQTFKRQNFGKYIGAFSGLAVGGIINASLKYGVARPRPYRSAEYLGEPVRLVNEILTKNSFPSGHTFTAFAIASLIACFRPKLAVPAYLLALLVGISRIYLAAHFPTDVLVGAIFGTIFVWGGVIVANRIKSAHQS